MSEQLQHHTPDLALLHWDVGSVLLCLPQDFIQHYTTCNLGSPVLADTVKTTPLYSLLQVCGSQY